MHLSAAAMNPSGGITLGQASNAVTATARFSTVGGDVSFTNGSALSLEVSWLGFQPEDVRHEPAHAKQPATA